MQDLTPLFWKRVALLAAIALSALSLVTGCGAGDSADPASAQATEPAPAPTITLEGFDGPSRVVMERLVARMDPDTPIIGAVLTTPPTREQSEGATPTVGEQDRWLQVRLNYTDDEAEQLRDYWHAVMLLAAYWRDIGREAISTKVWGGEVVFERNGEQERLPGLSGYVFQSDSADYLFRNAAGQPARLQANEEELAQRISTAAEQLGLQIENVAFPGVLGTAVEIRAVALDPDAMLSQRDWAEQLLGDATDLEGSLVHVTDGDGELVVLKSASTGLRRMVSVYGSKYQSYDPQGGMRGSLEEEATD
jgi:hypothetical protein